MTRIVLAIFDLFAWLIRGLGIDYPHFRAILEVKLTLDGRRVGLAHARRPGKKTRGTFGVTLFVNAFMGIFVAVTVAISQSPLVGLTIVFALTMVLIGMILIADYSSVLLDTTDNQILQPRPVSGRTILAARIAHIVTYLSLLALSLSAATFIVGGVRYGGVFVLGFALALAACIVLLVGAVSAIYLLAVRLVDSEKLRDIILYFQIVMTVLMTGGYQLMPRLMDMAALRTLDISDRRWIYFFPPSWFAGALDLLLGHGGRPQVTLTALAVCVPLLTLAMVVWLAPSFKAALLRLEREGAVAERRTSPDVPGSRGASAARGLGVRFASLLCGRPVERNAFELLWKLSGRDRQFKLRVYPQATFGVIVGAAMILSSHRGQDWSLASIRQTSQHLFILYLSTLMLPSAILYMRYSEKYEAAWMYRTLPLEGPGDVLVAGLKVLLVRLVLPSLALVAAVVLSIWGAPAVLDTVVAFSAAILLCSVNAVLIGRRLPFSEAFAATDAGGRVLYTLLLMFLPLFIGGAHYVLRQLDQPLALVVLATVLLLCAWVVMLAYRKLRWADVGATIA